MSLGETSVDIRRHVDAPPELVFAAFADPALVSRWLRPSPEIRLEVLRFEFHAGGDYRFAYHMPDGGVMHVNGSFTAIEPPVRLAFSWNIEPPDEHAGIASTVTVSIRPAAGGSLVAIRHEKLDRDGAALRHRDGWQGALENLANLFGSEADS